VNPLRLTLRNVRTFADLDLDLPEGRIAILGQNGAGKSTLATAVDWALFGPDGRSFAGYLSQGGESTEMVLELAFEHGGREYAVRRTYSSRGNGKTTLDLQVLEGDFMKPLTRETVKQTQEHLEALLGLNRATFRASSMLVQGDGAAFTEALPRDRKQILARILGLERWDGYLADAREQIRNIEIQITNLNGRLGDSEQEIEQRAETELAIKINRETIADATAKGEKAAADLKAAETFLREATAAAATRAAAVARMAQAELLIQPLDDRLIASVEAAGARQTVREEIDTLMTPAQIAAALAEADEARAAVRLQAAAIREAQMANAERDRLAAQVANLNETGTRLTYQADELLTKAAEHRGWHDVDGHAVCEHCGQPLTTPAAREHAANALEAQAAQLQIQIRAVREEKIAIVVPGETPIPASSDLGIRLEAAEKAVTEVNRDRTQRARLEERIAHLDRTIQNRPSDDEQKQAERQRTEAQETLAALPAAAAPAQLEAARQAATGAERARDEERIRWQAATGDLGRLEERLARIEKVAESVTEWIAERNQAHAVLDELKVLEHAYGRDGIPAWIVATVAIPSIEIEATRILAELGTSYRVELRTERATGAGELVDALDVIVTTPEGERPYETFSGGERTRINLALRIALARLLATRRSSASRLLVIDEPEFLDEQGTAALIAVIRGLDDFDRIWLISHVPDLRDAALDGILEVRRGDDGWSTVTAG
jgi:DNA repair protein SbcC/Rad50